MEYNPTLPTRNTFTGQYSYIIPEGGVSDDATDLGSSGFGLMFYQSRWYDPSLGRMAQADTIVPGGVQGLDRYAYVNNSPLNYVDPSGHFGQCHDGQSGYQCRMTIINAWWASNRGEEEPSFAESPHGSCDIWGLHGDCNQPLNKADPEDAIQIMMQLFGIKIPDIPIGGVAYGDVRVYGVVIEYDSTYEGDAHTEVENGNIVISVGRAAFRHSVGWLASSIDHELCHARQIIGDSCHTYVDSRRGEIEPTVGQRKYAWGTQGGSMNEIEAYDMELAKADYYFLTQIEIRNLRRRITSHRRPLYFHNAMLTFRHNYYCDYACYDYGIPGTWND